MKAPALLTPADWHEHMVALAVEAWDRTCPAPHTGPVAQRLRAERRARFVVEARERMAQVAMAVVLEIDLARSGR